MLLRMLLARGLLFVLLSLLSSAVCYEITSPSTVTLTQYMDTSFKFNFTIKPWPPLCVSCSDIMQNELNSNHSQRVTINFIHGEDVLICSIAFLDGIYVNDNSTVPCSNTSTQMSDYNPTRFLRGVQFELKEPGLRNAGNYSLEMLDGLNITRRTVLLIVYAPPKYPTIDPINSTQLLVQGSELTLTCRVHGANPPAELRWMRQDHEIIPNSGDYIRGISSGDETMSRIRVNVTRADYNSGYQCLAWNEVSRNQTTSAGIQIPVKFAPEVTINPCTQTDRTNRVGEGQSANFYCQAVSNPPPTSVQWRLLWSNGSSEVQHTNNTKYVMEDMRRNKQYPLVSCFASNVVGQSDWADCTIDVQYGPIVLLPAQTIVRKGQKVSIECQADARPPAQNFQWQKENGEVVSYSQNLMIDNIQEDLEGKFTCIAKNVLSLSANGEQYAQMGRNTTEIIVLYPPDWNPSTLKKFAVSLGKPLTLVCEVKPSGGEVWFSWLSIPSGVKFGDVSVIEESFRSSLHISPATASAIGVYTCVANRSGEVSRFDIEALSPGVPDTLSTCSLFNSSSDQATILCLPGYDGGETLTFDTFIQTDGRKLLNTFVWRDAKQVYISVAGLTSNTAYAIDVAARNIHGRSSSAYRLDEFSTIDMLSHNSPDGYYAGNVTAIIGGAVGGIIFIILLIITAVWAYLKHTAQSPFDVSPILGDNDDEEMIGQDEEEEEQEITTGRTRPSRKQTAYDDDLLDESQRTSNNTVINHGGQFSVSRVVAQSRVPPYRSKAELNNEITCHYDEETDPRRYTDYLVHIKNTYKQQPGISGACAFPASRRNTRHASKKFGEEVDTNIDEYIAAGRNDRAAGRGDINRGGGHGGHDDSRSSFNRRISVENSRSAQTLGVIELHMPPPSLPPPPSGKKQPSCNLICDIDASSGSNQEVC